MVFQDEVQRIFSFAISQLHAAESTEGGRVEKKVRINMVHVHACARRRQLTYSKARGRCLLLCPGTVQAESLRSVDVFVFSVWPGSQRQTGRPVSELSG